jgi:hypothetical protein
MAKVDLNKLKDEIQKEKQNKNVVPSQLGEQVGTGVSPRDVFLHGLMQARETGQITPSSQLIQVVENKVSEKHGELKTHAVNETAPTPTAPVTTTSAPTPSPDRDEQLFADLEKKRKATLAESIEKFQGATGAGTGATPPTVNYGGTQYLTSVPTNAPATNPTNAAPMQLNEAALVENVQNVVRGYLNENLGPIFEEAIKNTVIEMYAVERIKEVLNENRDLIKSVVVETIKEIRDRSKKAE